MLSVKAGKVNLSKDTEIRVLVQDAQFYFMFLPMAHNFIQRALFERSVSFSIDPRVWPYCTVLLIGRLLEPS
jgi:hypothetical protein